MLLLILGGDNVLFCTVHCAKRASEEQEKVKRVKQITRSDYNLEPWVAHIYNYYVGE